MQQRLFFARDGCAIGRTNLSREDFVGGRVKGSPPFSRVHIPLIVSRRGANGSLTGDFGTR